jgi:hypothetical protein
MGPVDQADHQMADWEFVITIIGRVLGRKGVRPIDEYRRAVEDIDPQLYPQLTYYERVLAGNEAILCEKGYLTPQEIDAKVAALQEQWGPA